MPHRRLVHAALALLVRAQLAAPDRATRDALGDVVRRLLAVPDAR